MSVLYITLGQTHYKTQFIYIVVSMVTMITPSAFQTQVTLTLLLGLLLNLQQSFMELFFKINYNRN
jgi:hypothetical protein